MDYTRGAKDRTFLSVNVGTIPIGFVSIEEDNKYTSEIYVLGIVEELHGRGIGKRVVRKRSEQVVGDEGE